MVEAFPTSGNIDPTTFPFLLMDLHRRGATGSLKVEGPSHPKALYLRGGRILFGSSNDPRDQLGSILIEQGKIGRDQLEDVNAKVGPGNPLAKVLAESGFVNQRELGDAARIKVERILSDVLAYTSGSFEFEDGVLPKGAVDLKLSTEKLLLAAVARMSDRAFVLRYIESLGVVLAPAPDAQARIGEIRSEATPLLERLDGRRSLKDAVAQTRLDEFEAAKLACSLLFLGIVARAEPGRAASEELDLAATARSAFGEAVEAFPFAAAAPAAAPTAPEPAAEEPFFVPQEARPPEEPMPVVDEAEVAFPRPELEPPAFSTAEPEPEGADLAMFESSGDVPPFVVPETAAAPPAANPADRTMEEPASAVDPEPAAPAFVFEPTSATPSFAEPNTATIAFTPAPSEPAQSPFEMETIAGGIPAISPGPARSFDDVPHVPSLQGHTEEHLTVPTSRPSNEDLAALDALLNPSASSIGAARPPERPRAERWEPQFRPAMPVRRPAGRRRGIPVGPLLLGFLGLAGAAAGGYYFLVLRPAQAAPVAVGPGATPPSVAAPTATTMPAAPSPSLQATLPPATAAAPPSTDPIAPRGPGTPPPTTAPRAKPTPPAGGDARGLLRSGAFGDAASSFAEDLRGKTRGLFSVQLLVACSEETIQKAVAAVPADELFILPVNYKGRSCYRVCWGLYASEEQAAAAGRSLPEYFRRGGATPKVSPIASLLP
jgi:hypothetical protein